MSDKSGKRQHNADSHLYNHSFHVSSGEANLTTFIADQRQQTAAQKEVRVYFFFEVSFSLKDSGVAVNMKDTAPSKHVK